MLYASRSGTAQGIRKMEQSIFILIGLDQAASYEAGNEVVKFIREVQYFFLYSLDLTISSCVTFNCKVV